MNQQINKTMAMKTNIKKHMRRTFNLLILSVLLTSCGDSESKYFTSIKNNTNYEIDVQFSKDSTIVCPANHETIIEEYYAGSVKKLSSMAPYIFTSNVAKIIVDKGNKTLIKDISDANNWSYSGEKDWDLIMVGNYYIEATNTFTINPEDIKNVE
jgi:hypothetical protein